MLSRKAQQAGDFRAALEFAEEAVAAVPGHVGASLRRLEARAWTGRTRGSLQELAAVEKSVWNDASTLQQVGALYNDLMHQRDAYRCYQRALDLDPHNPRSMYNLAASATLTGELGRAEQLFTDVIAREPRDFDAYVNRSALRTQTRDLNHVDELRRVLAAEGGNPAGEVQLCYALAKELEDMGEYRESFVFLKRGADLRRSRLSYQVASDVEAMAEIARVFDAARLAKVVPLQADAADAPIPIFVLGLPRSGTTLVDRIISSHTAVESLGELSDLPLAVMRIVGRSPGKFDLIRRSASVDAAQIGRSYIESVAGYERSARYFIDKTPHNYLYIGLIALALPQARILHLRRNPLDSCYAMYKTLFRNGAPFSYDLGDLATYYLAREKLMDHWHRVLPGRFLDVDYERLVADQETVSRQVVAHCGLEWQPRCLEFYNNESAAATASAAQVRQPIYRSSVERWRSYHTELQPLAHALRDGGVNCS